MARSNNGLFGRLSGRVGNVVLTTWKGMPIIRARPKQYRSNTPKQQVQRTRFKVVNQFVSRILPLINAAFKHNTGHMTEFNSATSYLMRNAVRVEEGQALLHFPSVKISRGELPPPDEASAQGAENAVRFRWTYDAAQFGANADDQAVALAYDPETDTPYMYFSGEVEREEEELLLPVPAGTAVETYLGFVAPGGTEAGDSVYLGEQVAL